MSKRLFGAIVLLIVIANAVYFAGLSIYSWRQDQAYQERLAELKAQSAKDRSLEALANSAAQAEIDNLDIPSTDDNQNVIDGQIVHVENGNWVNDKGEILSSAAD